MVVMVGGGRCPPLLVGGLVVACIMMVCNWWTLSSANLELVRQIDELNEQIKICVEERDLCVTQKEETKKQLDASQDDARTAHVKLSQVEDTLTTCNTELKSFQQNEVSKTVTLEALRVAKNTVTARLNAQIEENKKLEEELSKAKDELEKAKLSMNAPQPKPVPVLPMANPARLEQPTPNPHLEPVKLSAIEVSVPGQRGMKFHGVPILPRDPPGAVRLAPRYSVTKIKPRYLEKSENKMVNIGGSQGNLVINKTASSGNQVPNPQMKPPPNAENVDAPDGQEKDNSKIDNAAEVHGDNGQESEFNFNLMSDMKNRDNQNK
ncbi:uncharacterized protein LOC106642812 isoform X1 [Copidosoma floridanum]|uniref:uncharacterized protein LOC106642812 isoform X1 n=1 Tax=Copidosoma floridanum TaxID=29053 RepID=UPI000C6FBA8F|nr:uncharacterized protein LOC106642812 isoform X1 [Copidosoma floridanum]